MEKEKRESLLIDYIEGNLKDADRALIENEMEQNAGTKKQYHQLKEVMGLLNQTHHIELSHSLQSNFEKLLQQEMASNKKTSKQISITPWVLRIAAVLVLVFVGAVIMDRFIEKQEHEKEVAAIKKELNDNKKLMMALLQNQQSASQRLQGAMVAYEMNNSDDDIVNALVTTMNEDTNSNVRLSALEALGKFYRQNHVRSALIKSLSTQKDPVVQMALIRMLVKMKEKEVVTQLEKMTHDDSVIKAVKDEAHWGILRLI
ncbi:MAG: HEAT repeat domain-containing protein [Bacteroidetes bacterium]|nr:HEAT repeat domain-containing protein [Bacteroidota bacterium]